MTKYRSKLEEKVVADLHERGLMPRYEPCSIPYTMTSYHSYTPDLQIGDVFVEIKGYWSGPDRKKFLAFMRSNPDVKIFVAFQDPKVKLYRDSRTTLGKWATDKGIPWCQTPIPPKFIQAWLDGERITQTLPHEVPKVSRKPGT